MRKHRFPLAALAAFLVGSCVPTGHGQPADSIDPDGVETIPPTPATVAIWTDKLGYLERRDLIDVYLAIDPAGDEKAYREFIYLENIQTKERRYMLRDSRGVRFQDDLADSRGKSPRVRDGEPLRHLPPTRIWRAWVRVLDPGLWQFVAELRSPDTTEIVKTAHAKFVV